jgi:hypothetical protein
MNKSTNRNLAVVTGASSVMELYNMVAEPGSAEKTRETERMAG